MHVDRKKMYEIVYQHLPKLIMKSCIKNLHIAMIFKGKRMLAIATNFLGSRSQGCGFGERTIHAERAVIKKLGDHTLLDGAIMVVFHVTSYGGAILYSEPCKGCKPHLRKCMREYGLKCVYYSK